MARKRRNPEARAPMARMWRFLAQLIGGAIVGLVVAGALLVFAAPSEAAAPASPTARHGLTSLAPPPSR